MDLRINSIDEKALIQKENKPVWQLISSSTLNVRTFIGYTLVKSVKNLIEAQCVESVFSEVYDLNSFPRDMKAVVSIPP